MHHPTLSRIAVALIAVALTLSPTVAVAADDPSGVAWEVRTIDNANGAGRPNFVYDVDPGDVVEDAMLVANSGVLPLTLEVYAADAFTTSGGDIDILAGGTPSVDAGGWITPGVTTIELAPGASAEVPFRIEVPADARPGDHSAGLVTSLQEAQTTAGTPLSIERRLGSRLHLRVSGELAPAAAVTGLQLSYVGTPNPFGTGTLIVSYRLENTGNTRITAADTVLAVGPFGILPARTEETPLPEVLPGSTIEVSREISGVPALGWTSGTVSVAAEGVGLGAASIAPIDTDFSLATVPWALLVLLGLLLVVALLLVLLVRRLRRRAQTAS